MAQKRPKKQPDFYTQQLSKAKVGTVAIFGAGDDLKLYDQMAQTISDIHTNNPEVVISKMGEEVPEPTRLVEHELNLLDSRDLISGRFPSYVFRLLNHKIFLILYLEGLTNNGDPAWAYINIRGDRFGKLFEVGLSDRAFNLPDYSTLVLTGHDSPTLEDCEKLQRDYLFGEQHINIRIFPDQVETYN